MKIINLLPKEEIKEHKLELVNSQFISFWVWILVSLGVVFVLSIASSILLSQRISANNNLIEENKRILKTTATKQLEDEVAAINGQIALIEGLRRDHYFWSNAYIELVHMLDTDTILTTVSMDRETGEVQVTGEAADRESVLAFWASVKKSDLFKDINFPLTNLEKDVDANFTFTFYLNPEEMKKE